MVEWCGLLISDMNGLIGNFSKSFAFFLATPTPPLIINIQDNAVWIILNWVTFQSEPNSNYLPILQAISKYFDETSNPDIILLKHINWIYESLYIMTKSQIVGCFGCFFSIQVFKYNFRKVKNVCSLLFNGQW